MNRRLWVFLLCFIVIAALGLLASSLNELRFEAGLPLASVVHVERPIVLPAIRISEDTPVWRIVLIWLAFVVIFVLLVLMLPPELRKRILRQMLGFAVGVLALVLALRYHLFQWPEILMDTEISGGGGASIPPSQGVVQAFQPSLIPAWITYAVSLIILWGILGIMYFSYRWWRRYRARRSSLLAPIADIARASLGSLAAGQEWRDVVIQAYSRMSEAVLAQRGLQRASSSTPREFAARLARAGLPEASVDALTRLFESVRYGGRSSGDSDAQQAVACLEAILRACGAPA
jgi:hypothetical protein